MAVRFRGPRNNRVDFDYRINLRASDALNTERERGGTVSRTRPAIQYDEIRATVLVSFRKCTRTSERYTHAYCEKKRKRARKKHNATRYDQGNARCIEITTVGGHMSGN